MAGNSVIGVGASIITIWTAHETNDERGSHGALIGVFTSKGTAERAANGRGWYGGQGSVQERKGLNTSSGVFLLDRHHTWPIALDVDLIKFKNEKIEAAKAKLSAEEKELLGIK